MTWYNSSWTKRKPITLTGGASGAQTAYQVRLDVTYDSDMKSDFSDLRFTKANGTELLDAWLESKTDGISAVVWVKTDTPANTVEADIYMYYGNSGAANDWDGAGTFTTFDDFEGAVIDTSIWDCTATAVISTNQAFQGSQSARIFAGSLNTSLTSGTDYAIKYWAYIVSGDYMWVGRHGNGASCCYPRIIRANPDIEAYNGSTWVDTGVDAIKNEWKSFEFFDFDWSAKTFDIIYDDIKISNDISMRPGNATYTNQFGIIQALNCDVYIDCFIIRKYAANPATYAFGGEETDSDWTGIIINVTNPAKVFGIAVSDISKIMGV